MAQVQIGPEFFKNIRNDYADWRTALIREFMQNSLDAGASRIDMHITKENGNTRLVVENNGIPMSEDILVNKLLALGGSGKQLGQGVVGGFGAAKSLLYFCHLSYDIHSGDNLINGSGATYTLTKGEFLRGTRSSILIAGEDAATWLPVRVENFASYAQTACEVVLHTEDGSTSLTCSLRKGSPRREFDFGKVYTNRSYSGLLVVRVSGIPMFIKGIATKQCVVMELTNSKVLTSNRDALTNPYSSQLQDFITNLAVDTKSALKSPTVEVTRYEGKNLAIKEQPTAAQVVASMNTVETVETVETVQAADSELSQHRLIPASITPAGGNLINSNTVLERQSPLEYGVYMRNELGMKIPAYLLPESFSAYSRKLLGFWANIMVQMHQVFKNSTPFSVGFVFSDNDAAQYCKANGDDPNIYYINPVEVVRQEDSQSRSLKSRWKLTERNKLITVAAHEYVHGMGYSYHNEEYSSMFTDFMAKVLDHRKNFNRCFV